MGRNRPGMTGPRFHPGKASTLVTILLFPCLVSLGLWQLDRAKQKLALYSHTEINRHAPMLQISTARELAIPRLLGRSVQASGRYQAPNFLLDNRMRGGRAGYEIITPFKLNDGTHLLVARGWIVADLDRARLPGVDLPTQPVTLAGRLDKVPVVGIRLGKSSEIEAMDPVLLRIQRVETDKVAKKLGYPLPAGLVYLDAAAPYGYDRTWPVPSSDVSKHQAYAVQWFAMAVVLVLLYLKINLQHGSTRAP